jgi:hypothetical protein
VCARGGTQFRFAVSYYNINSIDDVSKAVSAAAGPVAASMRSAFSPMTTRLKVVVYIGAEARTLISSTVLPQCEPVDIKRFSTIQGQNYEFTYR